MTTFRKHEKAAAFFSAVLRAKVAVFVIAAALTLGLGYQLSTLEKDTSIDAFLTPDNPARLYREKVAEIFGLEDAVVIAVINDKPGGVMTPESLSLISWLTEAVRLVDGIDPEQVVSLATEKQIRGDGDQLIIEPLLPDGEITPDDIAALSRAIDDFPLYQGTLISEDRTGALIFAELLDTHEADQVYERLLKLAGEAPPGGEIHVAGEGAAQGYLADYIDADAKKLQPIAFVVILLVIAVAFRNFFSVLASLAIILVTLTSSLGLMAAMNIPYFAITGALPVILIGISIIDAVHILNHYYLKRRLQIHQPKDDAIIETMAEIWRPVVLTTLTTIAGFVGIAATSIMPPMTYFAIFSIVGLVVALLASLTLLPCLLLVYRTHDSAAYTPHEDLTSNRSLMQKIGAFITERHMIAVSAMIVTAFFVAIVARELTVDRKLMTNFKPNEPIRIADTVINTRFAGSNFLDVIVEADAAEGILRPASLAAIERLQRFGEQYDVVSKSQSIADYLKLMHRAVHRGEQSYYAIPDTFDQAAQYMLLYSASADPNDFRQEIDLDYEKALIRFYLTSDQFSKFAPVVQGMQDYIDTEFSEPGLDANLSGRVTLAHNWIAPLGRNHFLSVAISLVFVAILSIVLFRSPVIGTLTIIPVILTLITMYGVMGYLDIWLEPASYMFAAIALGLGIDFSIHMIERLQFYMIERGEPFEDAVDSVYAGPARALFTNCAAVGLGFSLLMLSELPTINRFGLLTAVALGASFMFSFLFMPSLVKWVKPKAIFRTEATQPIQKGRFAFGLFACAACLTLLTTERVKADALPSGEEIAANMHARDDGSSLVQILEMSMVTKNGHERRRTAELRRLDLDSQRKLMIRFTKPDSIDGTSFLTFDHADPGEKDDQWIYLPVLRRERRITPSDRGDYFFGTDFTYEDVKDSTKFDLTDFEFVTLKREIEENVETLLVSVFPRSEEIAREVGYSRVQAWIDPDSWMPVKAEYWDVAGNPLKTIAIERYEKISGYWTPIVIVAENRKTGHRTRFEFRDITYDEPIDENDLSVRAMKRAF